LSVAAKVFAEMVIRRAVRRLPDGRTPSPAPDARHQQADVEKNKSPHCGRLAVAGINSLARRAEAEKFALDLRCALAAQTRYRQTRVRCRL
jgi:hypothetical protein